MTLPTVHVLTWDTYRPGVNPTDRHASTRHIEVFPDIESLTHYRLTEQITWYTVDVCPVWPSKLTDLGQETVTEEARLRAKYGPNADGVMAMMGSIVDRIEATNDRRTTDDMERRTRATCSAHGEAMCGMCSRTAAGGLETSTEYARCRGCSVFEDTGMHWDTCEYRIRTSL